MSRLIEGAINYAKADKSDPFALARCLTHISSGVASHFTSQGKDAFYSADPYLENRFTADGSPYKATVYRNMARP